MTNSVIHINIRCQKYYFPFKLITLLLSHYSELCRNCAISMHATDSIVCTFILHAHLYIIIEMSVNFHAIGKLSKYKHSILCDCCGLRSVSVQTTLFQLIISRLALLWNKAQWIVCVIEVDYLNYLVFGWNKISCYQK